MGEGIAPNRQVNSAGKTHATTVVIKPVSPIFRRPQLCLCREREPKRSSVGYAHDHAASNTTSRLKK
ncbi:hypothetical protein NEIMUCOT_04922 [Neisseria mucosa ATCC 25996]|uniref:Uncharacterized protein n=1 Tax=Neisseria mucosa (strain ATCC 25996 / DSM 4631 / NCTC 10774 / M26) TaxID=546266 RepID=D2ZWC9_NEIM2|nr:hypothetical protein NEIMUCOT_04922 [Neisseria mucosa ATCC 25996]